MIIDWLIDLNGYFFPFTIVLRKKKKGKEYKFESPLISQKINSQTFHSRPK